MEADKSNYIVGLEVGTSKVVVVVGQVHYDGVINVIGLGVCASKGIERGNIIDLPAIVNSIKQAIEEAESIADVQIMSVTLAITGDHIQSFNEEGAVPIGNGEVTEEDIDAAMHIAKSIKLPEGLELLHAIPQEYSVDKQLNIKNPLGLQGVRLKAHAHLITYHKDWVRNLKKAVEICNMTVDDIVFSGLAASDAVLTEDEKDLGVCLIDIGAGTMDMAVYVNGFLRATKVINYAGSIVTADIASVFGASRQEADNIKRDYGSAYYPPLDSPHKQFELRSVGDRQNKILTKEILSQVISERYKELLGLAKKELDKLKVELNNKKIRLDLIAGIVLTGGGSQIEDITECASEIFLSQVRVGNPINMSGLAEYVNQPKYTTVLGLLRHSYYHKYLSNTTENKNVFTKISFIPNLLKKIFKKVNREF